MSRRRPALDAGEVTPSHPPITRGECGAALAFLAVGLVLRLLYIWHYRIDSDEPQHLHVVWGWTRGLLPYRDVFDNHSPLFQALFAPLFYLLGERADILLPMRAGQLPIFALTVFCVWKITTRLYSRRVALWTAVLTALLPPMPLAGDGWFLGSIEFRPDQLWALLWLLVLLVLSAARLNPRRALLAGLLLGLSFSVSMKTTLFLLALAQAGIAVFLLRRFSGGDAIRGSDFSRSLPLSAAGLIGIVIVPALVCLYFSLHGAIGDLYYGVIQHNVLRDSAAHVLGLPAFGRWLFGVAVAAAVGWLVSRMNRPLADRSRVAFLFFASWFYLMSLKAFWPVLTAEDYLPFFPALMLSVGPAVLWLGSLAGRTVALFAGPILAGVEMTVTVATVSPSENQTVDRIGMVADTLKLTGPEDFVMDGKGETIYRRRPFHYVLEKLTLQRMHLRLIPDDIGQCLIQTRTPLVAPRRIKEASLAFIEANYVPIAWRLRVLGKVLRAADSPSDRPCSFEIAVPQRYTLITPQGSPEGTLDGAPFTGPSELAAGPHLFVPAQKTGRLTVIWASAPERGYSPFAPIKADYKTAQD